MHKVADIAVALVIVAGIMVLTRPGSKGPQIIDSIGQGFARSVSAATGAGTRPARGSKKVKR